MPTDQSTDSATVTTRRAFLTRTAVGGALAAGAIALPVGLIASSAGAQDDDAEGGRGELGDDEFAAFAAPLELGAVQAYSAALTSTRLDRDWTIKALDFQSHHQAVADALVEIGAADAEAPVADVDFTKTAVDAINAAADQNAVLNVLAGVEEALAATHLAGVAELFEPTTARTVTQVLAVEGQQAALLAVAAGTPVAEVTPPTSTGDAAITMSATPATTTTTAAN